MSRTILETEDYRGFRIEISYGTYAESPRDWDNLGIMNCYHRKYDIGDKWYDFVAGEEKLVPEFIKEMLQERGALEVL